MPAFERKLRTSVSLSRSSSIARVRTTTSSTGPSAEPANPQNVRVVLARAAGEHEGLSSAGLRSARELEEDGLERLARAKQLEPATLASSAAVPTPSSHARRTASHLPAASPGSAATPSLAPRTACSRSVLPCPTHTCASTPT